MKNHVLRQSLDKTCLKTPSLQTTIWNNNYAL